MRKLLSLVSLSFCFTGAVVAGEATQKDAVAMAEKGESFLKANGKEKLIEKINAKDPQFVDGELYLVALDSKGNHLAHPVNSQLLGKSMLDVPDADGKMFRQERVDLAASKGKGWVDYKYKNPTTSKIENKTAYVLKSGDVILTVGAYKQ